MTADAVQAAAAGSPLPRAPYPRRFPLGRTLPPGRADQAAADGRARTLFERWRPFCDAGERLAPGAEERVAAAFPEAGTPPAAEREESGLHG
jgi:hypothetical protein